MLRRTLRAVAASQATQETVRDDRSIESLQPHTPLGHLIAQARALELQEPFAKKVSIKIVGVSFENEYSGESRQDVLARCRVHQPVLLVREPDNPYDSQAVTVHNTEDMMGYVPRDATEDFEHTVTSGFVEYVGCPAHVQQPMLGAYVRCVPTLRAAHIQALPDHLVNAADLSASLPKDLWDALERQQLDSTFHCCQMTGLQRPGAGETQDLASDVLRQIRAHPMWRVDQRAGVVRLEGLLSLSAPAIFLAQFLDLERIARRHAPAVDGLSGRDGRPPQRDGPSHKRPGEARFRAPAPWPGVSGEMLAVLAGAHGERMALDVARGAAYDALRFTNAFYELRDGKAAMERDSIWSMQDVQAYAAACWRSKQRMNSQPLKLDIRYLLNQKIDGRQLTLNDIPEAIRVHCAEDIIQECPY